MKLSQAQTRFIERCIKFNYLDQVHRSGTAELKHIVAIGLRDRGVLIEVAPCQYKIDKSKIAHLLEGHA